MRLTNIKEHAFKYLLGFIFSVGFLVAVAIPARTLTDFYDHLDRLSQSVERDDFAQARVELDAVASFYESSRAWRFQWLADSYLFRDAFLQQAAYDYLTHDYEAVVRELSDEIDDSRASHLLASAKFQLARLRYHAIAEDSSDAEAQKVAIIQEVIEDVNADYERALRSDLTDRFDHKWNYDLTSDAEAVRRALETPRVAESPELEQMRGEGTPVRRRRG